MKKIIILVTSGIFFATATCRAQNKPTKSQQDLQQTKQAIKDLGSLFKKKTKTVKDSTTANHNMSIGTDGNMPPPNDKMFTEPGGGLLVADSHGGTVLINGVIYEWGDRTYGQTGYVEATKTFFPEQVTTDNDWKKIYTGGYYNMGIKNDGSLWSWGWGNSGELGVGNIYHLASPQRVGYDTTWVTVSPADGHAAGIKSDGTLWIWGANVEEQLGIGPTQNSKAIIPMKLNNDKDWAMVAAGEGYTLALKKDGSLWGWGRNQAGSLGTETKYETQQAPIRIGHDNDWVKIFTGTSQYASFGIKADGTLWAWGYNRSNQLGIGNAANSFHPVQVGIDKDWVTVSNRIVHSLGIKADGSVWQWGADIKGIQRIPIRGKYIAVAEALNLWC